MTPKQRAELERLRDVITKGEKLYLGAKEMIAGSDEAWNARKKRLENELFASIMTYNPESGGNSAAAYRLGNCARIAREIREPEVIVEEYERHQTRFAELNSRLADAEEARRRKQVQG